MDILWRWAIHDLLDFGRICANAVLAHYVTQELHLALKEVAFLWFQFQVCLSESLENPFQILQVPGHCWTVNKDVIQVAETNLPLELAKDSFHESFKRSWCVTQPKRHHLEAPQASSSPVERGLVLSFFYQLHLPISRTQVHGRQELGSI